jgi:Cdc6-like AAA superfamily ATPase
VRKKIEEIEKRLSDVVEQKNALGSRESGGGSSPRVNKRLRPPNTSLVDCHVFGRESDRQKILDLLELESDDPYSVIPIVGMPGVGKTTLAQLVFNDAVVINSSAAGGWACVFYYFEATEITRIVLQSVSNGVRVLGMGLDMAQCELSSSLSGEKFLVVLDDVWTEKRE